jgi:two-component system, OmpR family, phosphate regulon sensor histidine kinase PhoR
MKLNRTYLFIGASSLALIAVLVIQVNWILQTAEMKEELFSEKANLVLSKTAEALSSDSVTVRKMGVFIGRDETHKIDSLLSHYMKIYHVKISYFFEVKPGTAESSLTPLTNIAPYTPSSYQTCLGQDASVDGNGLELKLVFPDKEEYVLQEMGIPFITSIVLILVVLVMFWRTTLSLLKEKEISEHTTEFLNNMTHEFKTPLTNIALAGKMITKEVNIKQIEKIKHYSGIILEENEKLRLQVEQVLSMTALERGEIPLQKREFDFHKLIHDSLKCIQVQIENKQGSIDLILNAENTLILGDKTHLTNALCNLIDNAIKYSNKNPEITIATLNTEQDLTVIISDKGIGIEEEFHDKIFEKFFRVPTGNVHDVKGFGLGLAYIKTIIELHDGKINLESESGEGTKFTITLRNV